MTPRPVAIFAAFFQASITGFGGVLPMARRAIVEERGWLTPLEFSEMMSLCQFLPGANVGNFAIVFGARCAGAAGSAAAMLGLLAAPAAIVVGLATLYERYGHLAPVQHLVAGLSAGSAGLIIATTLKIAAPLRGSRRGVAVAAGAFMVFGLLQPPFLPSLCVIAGISIVAAHWDLPA